MNVAIIAPSVMKVPPDDYGGSEICVWNLCSGLTEIGFDDYVLFAPKGSKSPNGQIVDTIDSTREFENEEERAWGICKNEIRQPSFDYYDLINDHTHMGHSISLGTKVVKSFHGLQTWLHLPRTKDISYVVLSEWHKKDCIQKYGEGDYPIIPHGIDLDHYPYVEEKEDYYLHPGLIAPHKGHKITFEVVERTGIKVIIAGEDRFVVNKEYVDWVKSECNRLGIEYLGTVSEDKKVQLLQNAKATFLPFLLGEAFSLLMIESFAVGTPVITGKIGCTPEIMDKAVGLTCSSVNEFVDSIPKIDKTYYARCRIHAEEMFDRKRMAKDYLELFEDVIKGERW